MRTAPEVFESLLGLGPPTLAPPAASAGTRERPEHTRVGASLLKGQAGVMGEVVPALRRREPAGEKRWVVLTDGERAWPPRVTHRLRGVPLIVALQHGPAPRWTAPSACHAEGRLQALTWGQERAWRLRPGEGSQVVQGLRLSATARQLQGQQHNGVASVAGSFSRHWRPMRDEESRRQGWPLATGVVVGACQHLIQDRLERSGRRWTPTMAEARLPRRAIDLSGDCDAYGAFHLARDHERLHPPGAWRPAQIIEAK